MPKIVNKADLPDALVAAVAHDDYSRGQADYSVTQLLQPVQKTVLEAVYDDRIEVDVADSLWALFGKAVHKILEGQPTVAKVEGRYYVTVGGLTVSGGVDRLLALRMVDEAGEFTGTAEIEDWKVTSVWSWIFEPENVKPEWVQQLNLYAHLLRENGWQIDGLAIVQLFRDWSATEAGRRADYPRQQVVKTPVELWTPEKAGAFLTDRLSQLHAAMQFARACADEPEDVADYLAAYHPCSDSDRWAKPTTWAVMKDGRKSALKVAETPEKAWDYIMANGLGFKDNLDGSFRTNRGIWIDERPGVNTRCERYCAAAPFCKQARSLGVTAEKYRAAAE